MHQSKTHIAKFLYFKTYLLFFIWPLSIRFHSNFSGRPISRCDPCQTFYWSIFFCFHSNFWSFDRTFRWLYHSAFIEFLDFCLLGFCMSDYIISLQCIVFFLLRLIFGSWLCLRLVFSIYVLNLFILFSKNYYYESIFHCDYINLNYYRNYYHVSMEFW